MKLNWKQQEWLKWYEGGLKDGYLMYAQDEYSDPVETPIRDIPVEPWYYQYKKESYEQTSPTIEVRDSTMNDNMRDYLRAGQGEATEQDSESTIEDPAVNEGSTPSQSTKEQVRKFFTENGRMGGMKGGSIGGKKRAEKLSKERRSEIARMGGLAKGKSK